MQRLLTPLLCTGLLMGAAACSDDEEPATTAPASDGSTTLAQGEDVELVGGDGIGGQTLNISAEQDGDEVTGELRVTDLVVTVQCADTSTDGVVVLGGEVTEAPEDPGEVGGLLALVIKEGDPDGVALVGNDADAASCSELLESIPAAGLTDPSRFTDVEAGSDIETS